MSSSRILLSDGLFRTSLCLCLAGLGLMVLSLIPSRAETGAGVSRPGGSGLSRSSLPDFPLPAPYEKPKPSGLAAKKAGQWIVDSKGAADSDTKSFAEAAANAKDGDTIIVRPGTYEAGLEIEISLTVLGQPGPNALVVLESSGRDTLWIKKGDFRAENIALRQKQGMSKALFAEGSSVSLKKVGLSAPDGGGLYVEAGRLRCEECVASGKDAGLTLRKDAGPAEVLNSNFSNSNFGVIVEGQAHGVHLSGLELRENGEAVWLRAKDPVKLDRIAVSKTGIWALVLEGEAQAEMSDSQLVDGKGDAVTLKGSSRLTLRRSTLSGNRAGVWAEANSSAQLEDVVIARGAGEGLHVQDAARVTMTGGRIDSMQSAAARVSGLGRLTLKGVAGAGNGRGAVSDDPSAVSSSDSKL